MMIEFTRSIDVEDEIRQILSTYMTAYCRPLPADFQTPCILVTQVGGIDVSGKIDTFSVTLDARATNSADANELLRNAIGILRKVSRSQSTHIGYITVNSSGSWGLDPARPDLAMYSARLDVVAHSETKTIN